MKKQRRKYTAEFKARVAFEAIRGIKTISEIADAFGIHPVMVGNWKRRCWKNFPASLSRKTPRKKKKWNGKPSTLTGKVGQLTMEVEFLEKSASSWEYS